MGKLTKAQMAALEFLAGCGGGFTAGSIAWGIGQGFSRSQSAKFRHRELLPLYAAGLIDKIDAEKPVVWVITDAGRAALTASDGPREGDDG